MNNEVALIILNYNGWRDTIKCLDSIYKMEYKDFYVVLIDNGSTDHSIEKIFKWSIERGLKPFVLEDFEVLNNKLDADFFERYNSLRAEEKIIIIRSKKNRGYAGGMNLGIHFVLKLSQKMREINYAMLLNNDTIVDKNLLKVLMKVTRLGEHIGAIGPSVYELATKKRALIPQNELPLPLNSILCRIFKSLCIVDDTFKKIKYVKRVDGSSYIVNLNAIRLVGGFDYTYYLYWEDTDLFKKFEKNHYSIVYVPFTYTLHRGGGLNIVERRANPCAIYFYCRNGIYYICKHYRGIRKYAKMLYFMAYVIFYLVPALLLFFKSMYSAQMAVHGIIRGLKISFSIVNRSLGTALG